MVGAWRFELQTSCAQGRLLTSCKQFIFNHSIENSRLRPYSRVCPHVPGCGRLVARSLQKSLHCFLGEFWALRKFWCSTRTRFLRELIFENQLSMVSVVRPNGNAQPFISVLCSPLRFAKQSPMKAHSIDVERALPEAFTPFLLAMHGSLRPLRVSQTTILG